MKALKAPDINVDSMREAAMEASAMLRSLANPDRLLLLCQISLGEIAVGELEETLEIFQPTLSQQLGVLRKENLVTTRRDGKQIYYAISDPKVLVLIGTVYGLYCTKRRGQK